MNKIYFPQGPNFKKQIHRGVGRYLTYLKEALINYSMAEICSSPQKAELIHYTYFDLFIHSLPIFRARNHRRQKLVVTIHDIIPLIFPKDYPVGHRGRFALKQQKYALRRVDGIITDSIASKNDLIKYLKIPAEKIHLVYLAANPHLSPPTPTDGREILRQLNIDFPYILYVGDINYNKNIPQLIKTLKFLPPEIKLICVGKNFIPQNIIEWKRIEEQLALSDVINRVIFMPNILGDQADAQLSALYAHSLAYVQPSLYEGFGLPILEAMQCGALVVCAKNSSLPEVAGDQAFYSESAQAADFALAIKEIIDLSAADRQSRIQLSLDHASKFTWKKVAFETNLVYQKIIHPLNRHEK